MLDFASLKLGMIVAVTKQFGPQEVVGRLVALIPAGAVPNKEAMQEHFARPPVPTRPSKYDRIVLTRRAGRAFVFALDKETRLEEVRTS